MRTINDLPREVLAAILGLAGPTLACGSLWNFPGLVCREWYEAIKPRPDDCSNFIRMMRSTCHPQFIFELMVSSGSHPIVVKKLVEDFPNLLHREYTGNRIPVWWWKGNTEFRDIVDALLDLLNSGCQRRRLSSLRVLRSLIDAHVVDRARLSVRESEAIGCQEKRKGT